MPSSPPMSIHGCRSRAGGRGDDGERELLPQCARNVLDRLVEEPEPEYWDFLISQLAPMKGTVERSGRST